MSKNKKEKLNKRTKFTIFAMFNIVWYTVVVLVASFFDHAVPSDLTVAWFAAWTVELALLFGIKVSAADDYLNRVNNDVEEDYETACEDPMYSGIEVQDESCVSDYSDDVG